MFNMKKIISFGSVGLMALLPFVSSAATTIDGIIMRIGGIVGLLMPILITIAAVWFVWNVILYTISGDDDKKKKAKDGIIQGLIGLFVIIAFWGIIALVMRTFGVDTDDANIQKIPYVPITVDGGLQVQQ